MVYLIFGRNYKDWEIEEAHNFLGSINSRRANQLDEDIFCWKEIRVAYIL